MSVTPTFAGRQDRCLLFDRSRRQSLGWHRQTRVFFVCTPTPVEHYDGAEGLSGDSVALSSKTEKESFGLRLRMESTAFAIRRSPHFPRLRAWEDESVGLLASRMADLGRESRSLDHIVNGTVSSIRGGKGSRVIKSPLCWKTDAGNLWVGVDDGLYLFKNGHSVAFPNRITSPSG